MAEVVKELAALKIGGSSPDLLSKQDNNVRVPAEKAIHYLKEKKFAPRKRVKICIVDYVSSGSDTDDTEDEDTDDTDEDEDDTDDTELEIDYEWEVFKRKRAAIQAANLAAATGN
ncbi:hypothetical protein JOM56_013123 [Amanita muscaria]